jgi:hypothetical protein
MSGTETTPRARAGAKADEHVRRIATEHAESQPELAAMILEHLRGSLPEFFADEDVAYDMAAAVDGNVRRLHLLLCQPSAGTLSEALPAEAADLLQSTIQHGIPLISLLDAYRSAQGIAVDWWREKLDNTAPPRTAALAAKSLSHLIVGYIDAAAAQIRSSYQSERLLHEDSMEGRRTHIVRKLLAGEPLDPMAAARTLDHPLAGNHVAAVVWRTDEDAPDNVLDLTVEDLAATLKGVRTLTSSARHRVYVWLSATGRLDPKPLQGYCTRPGVHVAISGVQSGIEGFVQAHLDAVQTAGVVRNQTSPPPSGGAVAVYEDFELVTLVSRTPEARDRLVRRVLGPLAADTAEAQRARETLQAYLDAGSSPSRAARRLYVHRNTVIYRLAAAERLIGSNVAGDLETSRRLEIELALRIVAQLGPVRRDAATITP